ncbi:MAG: hypothetical protein LBQ57_01050 [Spirochaetales bacterium]|jgi:DNA polymerase III epsilon subunit-like protein|nr:hypothetical protein [Spirochaetales bacterium]
MRFRVSRKSKEPSSAHIYEKSDRLLAAHNASFDMGVLGAALAWYGLTVPRLEYF